MKIFQRSPKDLNRRSFKDLKKILGKNCLKIFVKKINVDLSKIFARKSFNQNFHKIFSSKNFHKVFRRNSTKFSRRMRSREDLHKRSTCDLIL